jgi:hypothetical protein
MDADAIHPALTSKELFATNRGVRTRASNSFMAKGNIHYCGLVCEPHVEK